MSNLMRDTIGTDDSRAYVGDDSTTETDRTREGQPVAWLEVSPRTDKHLPHETGALLGGLVPLGVGLDARHGKQTRQVLDYPRPCEDERAVYVCLSPAVYVRPVYQLCTD